MIENKKAYHDYEILELFDCGLKLEAWEVKSIADNNCSIVGAHCKVFHNEVFLFGATMNSEGDVDYQRSRKLLLHRKEINKLIGRTQEKGLTLIPLRIYSVRGKFKLQMGLAKGKRDYDKRETEKKRTIENENRRIVKSQKLE
jgi:SsrA-binding protein